MTIVCAAFGDEKNYALGVDRLVSRFGINHMLEDSKMVVFGERWKWLMAGAGNKALVDRCMRRFVREKPETRAQISELVWSMEESPFLHAKSPSGKMMEGSWIIVGHEGICGFTEAGGASWVTGKFFADGVGYGVATGAMWAAGRDGPIGVIGRVKVGLRAAEFLSVRVGPPFEIASVENGELKHIQI